MADKLIKIDREKGKALFLRTTKLEDGSVIEQEVEIDLPKQTFSEGTLKTINRGPDGKMYETEETVRFPVYEKKDK